MKEAADYLFVRFSAKPYCKRVKYSRSSVRTLTAIVCRTCNLHGILNAGVTLFIR